MFFIRIVRRIIIVVIFVMFASSTNEYGMRAGIDSLSCRCSSCTYKKIVVALNDAKNLNSTTTKETTLVYNEVPLYFRDIATSITIEAVAKELNNGDYPLNSYTFAKDDCIIDVGAHVGVISIILAKLNPYSVIYAVEACPTNFYYLLQNIALNKIENIHPLNFAVAGSTGKNVMLYDVGTSLGNSGESTILSIPPILESSETRVWEVATISFDDLVGLCKIKKCALLKIDCEGSEYEFLLGSKKFQEKIVHDLVGEFHMNDVLKGQGYSIESLHDYCKQHITGTSKITVSGGIYKSQKIKDGISLHMKIF